MCGVCLCMCFCMYEGVGGEDLFQLGEGRKRREERDGQKDFMKGNVLFFEVCVEYLVSGKGKIQVFLRDRVMRRKDQRQ